MSLNLEEKKAVVAAVSETLSESKAAILAEYRGLSVAQISGLRAEARGAGVKMRVVKNTLARRAIKGSQFECLEGHLIGPVAIAAGPDPVAVAKVVSLFAKDNQALSIKVGAMDGSLLTHDDIKALAKLPGRDELLAQLLRTMQAPLEGFVRTLNEVPAKFVRTLAALRSSKQAAEPQ